MLGGMYLICLLKKLKNPAAREIFCKPGTTECSHLSPAVEKKPVVEHFLPDVPVCCYCL